MNQTYSAQDLTETVGVSIPYKRGDGREDQLLELAKKFSASVDGPVLGGDSAHYTLTIPDAQGSDFRRLAHKQNFILTQ